MKIAIIGSAGRGKEKWNPKLYQKAYDEIKNLLISESYSLKDFQLVSGGAAGADHLAISLHKGAKYPLHLHLPCEWDYHEQMFINTHKDGDIANYWHKKFSLSMDVEENYSLHSLHNLFSESKITYEVHNGFLARNVEVAKSNVVIALTWGRKEPPPGGTAHTWKLAKTKKRHHISLYDL